MRRRKPDTMEIQQMKTQAKEEKQRRQIEKQKLSREMELRKMAEREKQMLEQQLMQLQNEMRNMSETLVIYYLNIVFDFFFINDFAHLLHSVVPKKRPKYTRRKVASRKKKPCSPNTKRTHSNRKWIACVSPS